MKARPAPRSAPARATLSPPNRRQFLQQASRLAGGLGAAPLLLPARVWGGDGQSSPSNRIAVGLIGLGRQAVYANLPALLRFPDVQVVALCEVDTWRLEKAQKQVEDFYALQSHTASYRGATTTGDFRELLARPDLDAVMISTPDHWHVPMALAAVRAGKDVCCEKPLTRSLAEGRALSDAVRQARRVFRTDSEFRSLVEFRRACELVRNGKLGRLHTIRAGVPETDEACPMPPTMPVPAELDYDRWLGPAPLAPYTEKRVHPPKDLGRPGWMRVRDYCDGLILNWGTHLIDIAQWGNQTDHTGPVEIEGRGEFPPPDGLWNVLLRFSFTARYANGVTLHCASSRPFVRFEGDEGWVEVEFGKALAAHPAALTSWKPGPNDLALPGKTDKRDFIDAVKTRGTTMEDAEVGHRTSSVCHLGHLAIELGRKLRWDPEREQFLNDDEANRQRATRPPRAPWGS